MGDSLDLWTIYDRPGDYPTSYVVRPWSMRDGRAVPGLARTAPTLEAARKLIPRGLFRLGRDPADDPVIVETWI